MTFDVATLSRILARLPDPRRWLVGFSGGLDSTVLLHALVEARLSQPVVAIHVNHAMAGEADAWEHHCRKMCERWGVDLKVEQVTVTKLGRGWEGAARNARYRAFADHVQNRDVLLLAQHLDDQAETVLFHLLRGSGVRGLGGIAPQRPLGAGTIVRPLLSFTRQDLLAYARTRNLTWVEDHSNRSDQFDRNYLRIRVVPLLAARWPQVLARVQQTAIHCRASEALQEEVGEQDLQAAGWREERWGSSVDREAIRALSPARRNNLVRVWTIKAAMDVPQVVHCREIERQLIEPPGVDGAAVNWGNAVLRHYRGRLYLTPPAPPVTPADPLPWDGRETVVLPDGAVLTAQWGAGALNLHRAPVTIRWRRGGERCRPQGRGHSQMLKKLLQEYGLEPWLRDRVPLIYCGGELAAVGDLWICAEFAAPKTGEGVAIRWRL